MTSIEQDIKGMVEAIARLSGTELSWAKRKALNKEYYILERQTSIGKCTVMYIHDVNEFYNALRGMLSVIKTMKVKRG